MLKFKEFLKKSINSELSITPSEEQYNILSWDSGHSGLRKKIGKAREKLSKISKMLSWKSGHGEMRRRQDSVDEAAKPAVSFLGAPSPRGSGKSNLTTKHWYKECKESNKEHFSPTRNVKSGFDGETYNEKSGIYASHIHDHPHVKPKKFEKHHLESINEYSNDGSGDINEHLRHGAGDKSAYSGMQRARYAHKHITNLSSAFTKENTNRKEIHTYSGVPAHIGKALHNSKKGSHHHIAGFTSTSTNKSTAHDFAEGHAEYDEEKHIIHYHIKRGAGLSLVHHSPHSENEVLLHHGAHIQYKKTDTYHGNPSHSENNNIHVHHVVVHPDHAPLESYPHYITPKAPEGAKKVAKKKATKI